MRQKRYLAQRYSALGAYTGLILALCGTVMSLPLLALFAWPEEARHAPSFAIPALALVAGGATAWRKLGRTPGAVPERTNEITLEEGGLIVTASWILASLASAIPLALVEDLGPTRAVFESVSGWTTTGLSTIDVTSAAHVTLLWRSLMQLVGGAGLAIVMLAAITGLTGPALGAAEGRGSQLVPNVRQSARLVLRIYTGYVIGGILAYRLVGLGWFDALNHAFAAVSTGGFSTRTLGIGHWDSPAVELVTIVLMVLGNLSFVTAWLVLRGRWRAVARDGELRLFWTLLPSMALLLLVLATAALYPTLSKQVRVAVFEATSALTTTGFSTVTYGGWSSAGIFVILLLMLVGGGSCSTAGGIKQFRFYALYRALTRTLNRPSRPQRLVADETIQLGAERVVLNDAAVARIAVFVFLYLVTLAAGSLLLMAHGYSAQDSLFEFASSLGTVGLSVGVTSATTPGLVLWTQTAGMMLGRLEFLVLFAAVGKVGLDLTAIVRARPAQGSRTTKGEEALR